MYHKDIHLLSSYTLTPSWKEDHKMWKEVHTHKITCGVNPHLDTQTGDDAMTTWE